MNTNMLLLILILICWSNRINSQSCANIEDIGNIREGGRDDFLEVCGNNIENNGNMRIRWLRICNDDNSWSVNEATVWCRTFGYPTSGEISQRAVGPMKRNRDNFRNINCGFTNRPTRIIDCNHTQASGECMALFDITCLDCVDDIECGEGECNNGKCECMGNCENGGYCYIGTCQCPTGFTGSTCAECDPICQNNGTCQSDGTCQCLPGFTGDRCQECDPICQNNSTCQTNINGTCLCDYPYYGAYCENVYETATTTIISTAITTATTTIIAATPNSATTSDLSNSPSIPTPALTNINTDITSNNLIATVPATNTNTDSTEIPEETSLDEQSFLPLAVGIGVAVFCIAVLCIAITSTFIIYVIIKQTRVKQNMKSIYAQLVIPQTNPADGDNVTHDYTAPTNPQTADAVTNYYTTHTDQYEIMTSAKKGDIKNYYYL